jgi:hypothetical protein
MRRFVGATGLAFLFVSSVVAADKDAPAAQDKVIQHIVKQEDRGGTVTYVIMTSDELAKLQSTLDKEAKLLPKAIAAAEKEWKADPETKKKPFPKSVVLERKATRVDSCDSVERADKKLTALQDKLAKDEMAKVTRKADQDKERAKGKDSPKDKERLQKEITRDQEKELLYEQARSMVDAKLQEILAPAGQPKTDANKPDAAKPDAVKPVAAKPDAAK